MPDPGQSPFDHPADLVFQPSAADVHRQAEEWFGDPEIYAWFGANLERMRECPREFLSRLAPEDEELLTLIDRANGK